MLRHFFRNLTTVWISAMPGATASVVLGSAILGQWKGGAMSLRKLIAVCVTVFVIMSSAAMGDKSKSFAYVSGEKFLSWPSISQIHYVMGIADAVSYLTETTDVQRGLSECLEDSALSYITLQLITKDAVVEAAAKGNAGSISVTEQFFKQMKIACRNYFRGK